MDGVLKKELEGLAHSMSLDINSKQFALAMDKEDPHRKFRDMFYYPKMKDLPHGKKT